MIFLFIQNTFVLYLIISIYIKLLINKYFISQNADPFSLEYTICDFSDLRPLEFLKSRLFPIANDLNTFKSFNTLNE